MTIKRHNNIFKNKENVGILFVLPSFLGVAIFVLIPFIDVIKRSFQEAMSNKFVNIRNYTNIFTNQAFILAVYNTIRFIIVCIPLLVIFSLLLAVLVNSIKIKGSLFKTTFLIPMAIPVASVVLIWKVVFFQNGLLSNLVELMGYQRVDWLKTDWAFWILVISYIWRNIGYDMILWLAGLSNISPALYEAASIDGAGVLQKFFRITIPNLIPTLFTIVVLSLLNSFKVFREAYLIAGDRPHSSMYMLQHLFNNWFVTLDIDKLCAGATVVAIVILIFILLLQKIWGKEEEA